MRLPIEGGEARLQAGAVTERAVEIELRGRVYRMTYDPRETGSLAFIGFHTWTSAPGEPISDEDRGRLRDAAWKLLSRECGVRGLLEYVAEGDLRFYVLRESDTPARVLARVHSTGAEILRVERTVLVDGRQETTGGDNRLVVLPATARVVYPGGGARGEAAWREVVGFVAGLRRDDFYLTDFPWRFVEATGP